MTEIELLSWARGPGLQIATVIFDAGVVIRLFEILVLGRKANLAEAKGSETERHAPFCQGAIRGVEVCLAQEMVLGARGEHPERTSLPVQLGEAGDVGDGNIEATNHRGP